MQNVHSEQDNKNDKFYRISKKTLMPPKLHVLRTNIKDPKLWPSHLDLANNVLSLLLCANLLALEVSDVLSDSLDVII